MSNTYYRGQGKVWIASRDSTGAISGFAEVGDADKLEITQSETFDQVYESQSGARNKVVHTAIQHDVGFALDILNFNPANLARSVLGTTAAVTAGTVTNEIVVAYPGTSVFLAHSDVSAVVVKDSATSAITYVAGTDYNVNGATGRLDIISGGAITSAESLKVAYSYAASSAALEALTNTASREFIIVFEGLNMNQNGTPVILRCHRAYFNLAAAIAMLGTATQKFSVTGALLPAPEITAAGVSPFFKMTVKSTN
jgi:hypothetical protein